MVSVGLYIYSGDQDDMCFDWSMEEGLFFQANRLCYYLGTVGLTYRKWYTCCSPNRDSDSCEEGAFKIAPKATL